MSRGLTDEPLVPANNAASSEETDNIIRELIMGQNKLHDRIIDLERKLDHLSSPESEAHSKQNKKFKILGL